MMKNEVEEFNGVYRIVFSSSFVYVGKNGSSRGGDEDKNLLELVKAEANYGTEIEGP